MSVWRERRTIGTWCGICLMRGVRMREWRVFITRPWQWYRTTTDFDSLLSFVLNLLFTTARRAVANIARAYTGMRWVGGRSVDARQRQWASDTYFNSLHYFIVCILFGVERTVQSTQDAFGSGHSLCGAKEPFYRALYTAKIYSLLCFDAIFSSFFLYSPVVVLVSTQLLAAASACHPSDAENNFCGAN